MTVAAIEGDGIGPELIQSAVSVPQEVARLEGIELTLAYELGGAEHYCRTGAPISDGALDRLRVADGVLKGHRLGYRKYGA